MLKVPYSLLASTAPHPHNRGVFQPTVHSRQCDQSDEMPWSTGQRTALATRDLRRWLDALSTRSAVLRWGREGLDQWAALLADVDPMHQGTVAYARDAGGCGLHRASDETHHANGALPKLGV